MSLLRRSQEVNQCFVTMPYFGEVKTLRESQMCECARIGKRPLSWAPWMGAVSKGRAGTFLDRNNVEMAHEHIFFPSTNENIGFGPRGLFEEDVAREYYRWERACYNGSLMREALRTVKGLGAYNFLLNNCQDFIAKVKSRYRRLVAQ